MHTILLNASIIGFGTGCVDGPNDRDKKRGDPRGKGPNPSKTNSDDSNRSDWATNIGHVATKWAAITTGVIMIAGIIMTFFVGAVPPPPPSLGEKRTGEHGPIPEPKEVFFGLSLSLLV